MWMFFSTFFLSPIHKVQVISPAPETRNCISAFPLRVFVTGYRGEIVLSRRENSIWKHQQGETTALEMSFFADDLAVKRIRGGGFRPWFASFLT